MTTLNSTEVEKIGAVAIGRNEGERLKSCLLSLKRDIDHVVYVDSGSKDGSVALAQSLGVEVVLLDLSVPFTAARARNAGLARLLEQLPELTYIQFVDGDCEVQPGWLAKAARFLSENKRFAIACGRRRERFPEITLYNQLCDLEWDTPFGEAKACGGDALIRVQALKEVEGYREGLIAGEEPEMCFRMRELGWKVMRLNAEMTLHDAAMTRLGQWWKRNKRAGHAYAEGYALHGKTAERFKKKECMSIVFWAAILPTLILIISVLNPWFISLFTLYLIQIFRLALNHNSKLGKGWLSLLYATSNVMGKWPQLQGILSYLINVRRGNFATLIEYK